MARERIIRAMPLVVAIVAIVAVVVLVVGIGGRSYQVRIEFRNADGIRAGYFVDIAGAQAGQVDSVTVNRAGLAVVTATLNHGAYPIGSGASASALPVDLLGEKYVALKPGDLAHPQPSGTVIPATRTSTEVGLDQILDALSPSVDARLRLLINAAGSGLDGQGTNLYEMLRALPPGLRQSGELIAGLSASNANLSTLIAQGSSLLAAIDSRSGDLQSLIVSSERALRVLASRQAQLAQTVTTAPPALDELAGTLGALRSAAAQLGPAAGELRATAPYLTGVLRVLPAFSRQAVPALGQARLVAPLLEALGVQGTPTVRALVPTLTTLGSFAHSFAPTTAELSSGGAMESLLRFANNWATLTDPTDGLGHVFRVRITLDPATFQLPTSVATHRRPARPAAKAAAPRPTAQPTRTAPASTIATSTTPSTTKLPLAGTLTSTVHSTAGVVQGTLGQADQALQSLVHYLLGR